MSKQVRAHQWYQESHAKIHDTAQGFDAGKPADAASPFHENAIKMMFESASLGTDIQKTLSDDWRGKSAQAMQAEYTKFFHEVNDYTQRMHEFATKLPQVVSPMQAAKNIPAPMSASEESNLRQLLKMKGMEPDEIDSAITKKRADDQDFARYQMTGQFSQPVVTDGASGDMDDTPQGAGADNAGAIQPQGAGGGAGSGTPQGLADLSKIGQGGDTKPAFDQGNQNGQGAGQGQGGSGGGSPSGSGGSGGGPGSGLGGLGSGSDRGGLGSSSPYGGTTAASYHPPTGGTGSATSGPGALRPGLGGVPGLSGNGAGNHAAGFGGSGVRGGAAGMGGMGMGGAGAHGRGGQGEEDDDHETPSFLINWDHGNALFGDLPPASPGVIGDWSEQERAEKQRLEAEKKRYKSLGWDVKFE